MQPCLTPLPATAILQAGKNTWRVKIMGYPDVLPTAIDKTWKFKGLCQETTENADELDRVGASLPGAHRIRTHGLAKAAPSPEERDTHFGDLSFHREAVERLRAQRAAGRADHRVTWKVYRPAGDALFSSMRRRGTKLEARAP